jgi:hypothetical protein
MQSDWASEHLHVIRTLMERTAIYRRALGPMMLLSGLVGLGAAVAGWLLRIDSPQGFIGYWLGVSVAPLVGSFLLVRRQALRDGEPLWSPPARRVGQAVLPALAAGLVVTLVILAQAGAAPEPIAHVVSMAWLPLGWVILYGCAIHAAGFFMPRGIKLFGWIFIAGGCLLFAAGIPELPPVVYAHGVMGLFFGVLHLAYGVYLYFTEDRTNAA